MNVKQLLNECQKNNFRPSIEKNKMIIIRLMGKYNIKAIDKKLMKQLLIKLDHMEYEIGYAKANDKVLREAEAYRNKKINMRLQYNITSSTLYNVLEGKKVSIPFALDFCKINNLVFKESFKVYSIKKAYSINTKSTVKSCIKRLIEYAIDKGYIKSNPVPQIYSFKIDEYRLSKYLPDYSLKEFVDQIFKHKNLNGSIITIIFILVGLNYHIVNRLRINNFDFKRKVIKIDGDEYRMSDFISNYLHDYYMNENIKNKILESKDRSYCRTIVYRIRDEIDDRAINLDTLLANYSRLLNYLNNYVDTEEVNCNNYKQNGLDNLTQYNDFKEFLRLKKQYEGN